MLSEKKEVDYSWYLQIWGKIVKEYSSRKLTKGEDKLVALSGLAKEIQLRTGDEYLAGLWRRSLPMSLLWACTDENAVRFQEYRAPSWSWAALDGEIVLDYFSKAIKHGQYHNLVQVQEVKVISAIGDVMTQVSGGSLSLKGRLTTCSYIYTAGEIFGKLKTFIPNGEQVLDGDAYNDIRSLEEDRLVEDLYCIPIILDNIHQVTADSEDLDSIGCLLLQYTQEARTFKRFGIYSSGQGDKNDNNGTNLLRDACDFFDASTSIEDWDYEETEQGKKYTITII